MKVFVTGGSGYLGRNVIRWLINEKQWEVVAIARSASSAQACREAGAHQVVEETDLSDVDKLAAAAQGCDYAVHCAASVAQWSPDWSVQRRINVDGTRNVIEGCRRSGVRKVIHVGTENALLDGHPLVNADETHPYPKSSYSPYSTSKKEAELAALEMSTEECAVIVVRPRFIWGDDDSSILPVMGEAAKDGRLKWFSGGRYKTSTVHVRNCCHGIVCALERGVPRGIYFLTDGEPVEFRDFITRLLDAGGVSTEQVGSLPLFLVWGAAAVMEWWASVSKNPPLINRAILATMGVEVTVCDARARSELGYTNVISIEDGLSAIAARYKDQGRTVFDEFKASSLT